MSTVRVELGKRSYNIVIKANGLGDIGRQVRRLSKTNRVVVITDKTIGRLYSKLVQKSLIGQGFKPFNIEVPDGEASKSFSWADRILGIMIEHKLDRLTPVIALGGGVVGDLGGFVASVFLRGVPLMQVPTTLLAQVDSSIGGKTAINHPKGKNLIGAFYQPSIVFIDPATLETLPQRQLISGLAEVVKYGVIRDKTLFQFIEKKYDSLINKDLEALSYVIGRCCHIKAKIVSRDEREETGERSLLNFGHTIGHAIETASGYGRYTHGEAVAIGMIEAARISGKLVDTPQEDIERLEALVCNLGLPGRYKKEKKGELLEIVKSDKKMKGEKINFVVMNKIGQAGLYQIRPAELFRYLK